MNKDIIIEGLRIKLDIKKAKLTREEINYLYCLVCSETKNLQTLLHALKINGRLELKFYE